MPLFLNFRLLLKSMDFYGKEIYNIGIMITILTLVLLLCVLAFPTLMLTLSYPISKKWALFWSNYITSRSARLFFAVLKCYRGFQFLGDKDSKKDLPEQFLVVSNHQSLIDIVVYLVYFAEHPVRFVAKDTLGGVPMVGKMLRSQGHCLIPRRGSPAVAMRTLEKFANRVMEKAQIPVIFPEGTRSRDGNLGQFYSAGFRRLVQYAKIPVAVCALDGGYKLSRLDDIFRKLKKGAYRVKVLKVYDSPASKEEEKQLLEESRNLIQSQLDEWRNPRSGE